MQRSQFHQRLPEARLRGSKFERPTAISEQDGPEPGRQPLEAMFAAYHILGRDTAGLLDAYYWADEFLRRNAGRL